jgi:ABC-type nitrate/sulfonate/bicarbonate transport system substrate-binding protein
MLGARRFSIVAGLVIGLFVWILAGCVRAEDTFRVSYGGYNETAAPMWVGIERGIFKKYGIDGSMIQVRSGALSVATLVAKEVDGVYAAQSTILSTVAGGVKLGCIASAINKIPRLLIARKDIKRVEDLREKVVGVQSVGGGFWLQTMIMLDHLGIDPDKFGLKTRVIGDGQVIVQALLAGNIDVAALTYSLAEAPLKAGFNSLADAAEMKAPYQGPSVCALKESIAGRGDFFLRLARGLAAASAFILDGANKLDVVKVLQKNLRLAKTEEAEAAYKVTRISTTLDLAPNPAAYKIVQRLVGRINPKINQVDLDQVIDPTFVRTLENAGFLAELRRRIK